MGDTNNPQLSPPQHNADYLAQLLKEKKQVAQFPNVFIHLERLLDEEISKVRLSLFHLNGTAESKPLLLPEPKGACLTLTEKVFVPVKEHPDFNFVGRILGPRGMTAKQLEQDTGCKIMIRGKGSMRDKKKEEANRGKPNWEHLNEELHVLLTVEDTAERAKIKLQRAMEYIKQLLIPSEDGVDDLKKVQLMELAMIKGTFRDHTNSTPTKIHQHQQQQAGQRLMSPPMGFHAGALRSPTAIGAPLILPPRIHVPTSQAAHMLSPGLGGPPPLISPNADTVVYPYEYQYLTAAPTALMEYPQMEAVQAAAAAHHHHAAAAAAGAHHIAMSHHHHPHAIGGLLTR